MMTKEKYEKQLISKALKIKRELCEKELFPIFCKSGVVGSFEGTVWSLNPILSIRQENDIITMRLMPSKDIKDFCKSNKGAKTEQLTKEVTK